MPTSLKNSTGNDKLHKYNRPFSGECGSGRTGISEYFVRNPGVPQEGGSIARTGARFEFAQSAKSE